MATVSAFSAIKLNARVNATRTHNNGAGTLYTAPADGYARIQVRSAATFISSGQSGFTLTVGGLTIHDVFANSAGGSQTKYAFDLLVPPGAAVAVTGVQNSGGSQWNCTIEGVEFKNSISV